MERMTLREAAERTSRSITTLRRYIRSGRLHAEKRYGRFGPEYFVSVQDLDSAGLEPEAADTSATPARSTDGPRPATAVAMSRSHETIPVRLFEHLQMKHEQLLVQYGMVRAGGLRAMELQGELADKDRELSAAHERLAELRQRLADRDHVLERELEESHRELEARALEIAALREKVRGLEMLTRNAVTNEHIERQFSRVMEQARKVEALGPRRRTFRLRDAPPADEPRGH